MAITTNTLGTYSQEIVVTQTSNILSVFNTVNTWIYTQGWSLVPDATLSGNSTNRYNRVYQSATLSGSSALKYCKINLMDLSVDTANVYVANTTIATSVYYQSTAQAYRYNHWQHFSYPRDAYFYRAAGTDAGTTAYTVGTATAPLGNTGGTVTTGSWTIATGTSGNTGYPSATSWSIAMTSGQGWQFYPGQNLVLYSPSTGHYCVSNVNIYNDTLGTLFMNPIVHATAAASVATDWTLLAPQTLAYNQYASPAYVYVSASPRHLAIQTRNVDGTWNDWSSVCELENPLGVNVPSYGVTTGYMLGNSGYTEVTNGTIGFANANISGSSFMTSWSRYAASTGLANPTNGAGVRQTALPYMNKNGKYVLFTGPFAMPITNKGRTGNVASQFNKIVTTLGEVGYIGTVKKEQIDWLEYGSATAAQIGVNAQASVYYKGLGDVMPSQLSTINSRHWAVSMSVLSDVANDTAFNTITDNTRLDHYEGWPFNQVGSTSNLLSSATLFYAQGNVGSYRDQSQWRTEQPAPMGRIFGMKAVTTGLLPINTLSINVDSNLMVTSSGTGTVTDHIVFSYPSSYTSYPYQPASIANAQAVTGVNTSVHWYPVDVYKGKETALDQANIRLSQSAAVAFPK